MKELILKIFITLVSIGVDVVGITFIGTNLAIGIGLIILGTIGIITTLLFSRIVNWRRFWQSVLGLPSWKCYGPKYSIGRPIPCREVLENPPGVRYMAIIGVVIKNRDKYPLGVNLDSARVYLEQKTEWRKVSVKLENHTGTGGIMLQPTQEREFRVLTIANCIGNYEDWPTLKNPRWGVRGIYVTFRGNMRELHKGLYKKPTESILV
jgi:hypothetical protein